MAVTVAAARDTTPRAREEQEHRRRAAHASTRDRLAVPDVTTFVAAMPRLPSPHPEREASHDTASSATFGATDNATHETRKQRSPQRRKPETDAPVRGAAVPVSAPAPVRLDPSESTAAGLVMPSLSSTPTLDPPSATILRAKPQHTTFFTTRRRLEADAASSNAFTPAASKSEPPAAGAAEMTELANAARISGTDVATHRGRTEVESQADVAQPRDKSPGRTRKRQSAHDGVDSTASTLAGKSRGRSKSKESGHGKRNKPRKSVRDATRLTEPRATTRRVPKQKLSDREGGAHSSGGAARNSAPSAAGSSVSGPPQAIEDATHVDSPGEPIPGPARSADSRATVRMAADVSGRKHENVITETAREAPPRDARRKRRDSFPPRQLRLVLTRAQPNSADNDRPATAGDASTVSVSPGGAPSRRQFRWTLETPAWGEETMARAMLENSELGDDVPAASHGPRTVAVPTRRAGAAVASSDAVQAPSGTVAPATRVRFHDATMPVPDTADDATTNVGDRVESLSPVPSPALTVRPVSRGFRSAATPDDGSLGGITPFSTMRVPPGGSSASLGDDSKANAVPPDARVGDNTMALRGGAIDADAEVARIRAAAERNLQANESLKQMNALHAATVALEVARDSGPWRASASAAAQTAGAGGRFGGGDTLVDAPDDARQRQRPPQLDRRQSDRRTAAGGSELSTSLSVGLPLAPAVRDAALRAREHSLAKNLRLRSSSGDDTADAVSPRPVPRSSGGTHAHQREERTGTSLLMANFSPTRYGQPQGFTPAAGSEVRAGSVGVAAESSVRISEAQRAAAEEAAALETLGIADTVDLFAAGATARPDSRRGTRVDSPTRTGARPGTLGSSHHPASKGGSHRGGMNSRSPATGLLGVDPLLAAAQPSRSSRGSHSAANKHKHRAKHPERALERSSSGKILAPGAAAAQKAMRKTVAMAANKALAHEGGMNVKPRRAKRGGSEHTTGAVTSDILFGKVEPL